MKIKGFLILVNWAVLIVLILSLGLVINIVVSAFYQPNGAFAHYYNEIPKIWGICFVISLLLAIGLSTFRKYFTARGMLMLMGTAYGILLVIATVQLIQVEPVPDHFIHSVGNVRYEVPREFTSSQDSKSGVRLLICLKTLKGIYDPDRGDCKYERVALSLDSLTRSTHHPLPLFFDRVNEFDLDGDKVILLEGAEGYQIQSTDKVRSYTIINDKRFYSITHLQIDYQDGLTRFVSCRKFTSQGTEKHDCNHWVKTSQGILEYELKGSANFDLELWQKTDKNLLNLISSWRLD